MLNGNLCVQLDIIGVLNGSLDAQREVLHGVHIVVIVNNILNVKPSPSRVLSHMNLMCGFCMEGWIELRTL